jgi:hypothetical protein
LGDVQELFYFILNICKFSKLRRIQMEMDNRERVNGLFQSIALALFLSSPGRTDSFKKTIPHHLTVFLGCKSGDRYPVRTISK